ncbi:BspA family leucine-rich repeat surface protein, partial [Gardnerella vaginalis]
MAGCEAEIKDENGVKYLVIKPKNNANEGIISADLRSAEFEAIRDKLKSNNMYGATLKFEGRVYGYGSIEGLFSETHIASLGNIDQFDVSNVTDMSYMFSWCKSLESLNGLEKWNTGNVTDMSYMFSGCKYLKGLDGLEKWNTSNVTNMNSMFSSCFFNDFDSYQQSSTFLNPISNWDVRNVTDMGGMFYFGKNLVNIDALKSWDTSNVKNMKGMFSNCKKLKNLDGLQNWKTSNVTDMSYMFEDCESLLNINGVANWNTGNVTNMQRMFANCLRSVKASGGMCGIFTDADYCKRSVSDLNAVKNWDVRNVSKMGGMFAGSETLTDISALNNWTFNKDLPYIDLVSLVTDEHISEDNYVIFLKNLMQKLKDFQGRLELDGFVLEKLSQKQINEIFGNLYDSIIIIHEWPGVKINTKSAIFNLKTKKQVTLTFTGSTSHSIDINDFPAVYISSEAHDDDNDEEQNKNDIEAVKSVVNTAIESKIKELQETHPELTGNYAASRAIANVNDVFQTYNLEVDKSRIKNPDPDPTPTPLPPTPEPEPEPTPDPTPDPNQTPGGGNPGGGLNPNGGGSGDKPGNNPNNPGNGSNNGNDNTNGSGDGTGNDNTKNDGNGNGGTGNGSNNTNGNNTNGSNTNRNRNGGSAGG